MPPMPDDIKASAMKLIVSLLQQVSAPNYEDSASAYRVGLAMALGGVIVKVMNGLTENKAASVFTSIHVYLTEATDEEIVSLFREGTAASVN